LLYNPKDLSNSSFYPFAEFSPEWQAVKYAQENNIEYIIADLPKKISFGLAKKAKEQEIEKLLAEKENENKEDVVLNPKEHKLTDWL